MVAMDAIPAPLSSIAMASFIIFSACARTTSEALAISMASAPLRIFLAFPPRRLKAPITPAITTSEPMAAHMALSRFSMPANIRTATAIPASAAATTSRLEMPFVIPLSLFLLAACSVLFQWFSAAKTPTTMPIATLIAIIAP